MDVFAFSTNSFSYAVFNNGKVPEKGNIKKVYLANIQWIWFISKVESGARSEHCSG